jgi:hypothetical protein
VAARREQLDRLRVERDPLRLHVRRALAAHVRPLVPRDAEPAQIVEHRRPRLRDHPLAIEVLHAERELPAARPRRRRAEESGGRAAEVEIAGG